MAFVSERASDEDVVKYDLDKMMREFTPFFHPSGGPAPGFHYSWIVDRERDIYVIQGISDPDDAAAGVLRFRMRWHNQFVTVHVAKVAQTDVRRRDEIPVTTTWNLVQIRASENFPHTRAEIIAVLKEVLIAYKISGDTWPIKQHTAVFLF